MIERVRRLSASSPSDQSPVRGRPFKHGNPGRPPGSKNKLTRLLEELVENEGGDGRPQTHRAREGRECSMPRIPPWSGNDGVGGFGRTNPMCAGEEGEVHCALPPPQRRTSCGALGTPRESRRAWTGQSLRSKPRAQSRGLHGRLHRVAKLRKQIGNPV